MRRRATNPAAGSPDLRVIGRLKVQMIRYLGIALAISLLIVSHHPSAQSLSVSDPSSPIPAAAMKLVAFGADPNAALDAQAIAALVDFVLEPKQSKEAGLPKIRKATGAYYEFDTRISFSSFLQYAHSSQIPSVLTSPASLRYSRWTGVQGEIQKLPASWKLALPNARPVIIRGSECDGITPDLTTGVYYEYNLKRTLILLNYKGRQVLINISNQIAVSDVGKKGVVLGNDDDWNYYYSGETGSAKTGLGWIKSYIYDYFSVGVYVESGSSPSGVRSGFFQWIRAGWSGINFVETKHVILGMKRHAKNFKTILESPKLPALSQIVSKYQQLLASPQKDLLEKYTALQQARQSLAVQSGQIEKNNAKKTDSYVHTSREQIVEELMLEYLKITFGKTPLLGEKVVSGKEPAGYPVTGFASSYPPGNPSLASPDRRACAASSCP